MCETHKILSRAFELRGVTNNAEADGETDFRGPQEFFDTEQRIQYLEDYAEFARSFFDDPNWDKPAVDEETVATALQGIKPQPQPSVRRRISLNQGWKRLGYSPNQEIEDQQKIDAWLECGGVLAGKGSLRFEQNEPCVKPIAEQTWRFFLEWSFSPAPGTAPLFHLGDVATMGLKQDGSCFYISGDGEQSGEKIDGSTPVTFKVEVDLELERFNVYANERLIADFVPVLNATPVREWVVEHAQGLVLHHVWGVGYRKSRETNDPSWRLVPFSINTFIDEDFRVRPTPEGWTSLDVDDREWEDAELPCVHGGERYRDQDLYLRRIVKGEIADRVMLTIEQVYPRAEVWINGRMVDFLKDNQPTRIDVTDHLVPGRDNVLALRVHTNRLRGRMHHTTSDPYTGWFAGRMALEYTGTAAIQDVFVYTGSLSESSATVHVRVEVKHEIWGSKKDDIDEPIHDMGFDGQLHVALRRWYPEESEKAAAEATVEIKQLDLLEPGVFETELPVSNPALWSPEDPQLYSVRVTLMDDRGNAIDDEVVTTGIRTVSQENGIFRLNGKPSMMNGALIFSMRPPLSEISRSLYCSPDSWLMKDLLMIKAMNGNTARMSIHDWLTGFCNDPRYCEMADQVGIFFQWQTGTWVRSASCWLLDFETLPRYVRQVRNHPSIVVWQPSNHPKFERVDESRAWGQKVFDTIYREDPSRMIAVTSSVVRMGTPDDEGKKLPGDVAVEPGETWHFWVHPKVARGGMETPTGYGNTWDWLRTWGKVATTRVIEKSNWCNTVFLPGYLKSTTHAYFNFENEESTAQPNWNLCKGKPYYRFMSYEIEYDTGSIGRRLSTDEWETSQAWQAFSAHEAIRWERCLGYDGFAWCCLRGGGNTATYQKPIIDYEGRAKMAFYALKMVYQPLLAGSRDVDVVYGPGDKVHPVILNVGKAQTVDLHIAIRKPGGKVVKEYEYPDIEVPAGKQKIELSPWEHGIKEEGNFVFVYTLKQA